MYFEAVERAGDRHGVESLRNWVRQAEVDRGERRGTTTEDAQRIAAPEREVPELRRANEILKSASLFFATELDGRRQR
jgi:transposase